MSPPRDAWWHDHDSSGPIDVEGGIKAKSKRGAIGEQWWSRRFLAVLDSYGMAGRLQRGRSYARRGQVMEFELTAGTVTARVQGSRPDPYRVTLRVRPLTAKQWRAVEAGLAAAALFRARLLAGEMPAEIEQVFADCGTPLFPQTSRDLDMACTCPDWGVPCKHVAAVCYMLAEAFDEDPFALLAWRGRDRDELLTALRGKMGRPTAVPAPAAGVPLGDSPALTVLSDVTGEAGDFWTPGLSPARLRALPQSPATPPDLLLRLSVPPAIEVRGQSLADLLQPVYERLAAEGEPLAE